MKQSKRIIAIILTVLLVATFAPMGNADAAGKSKNLKSSQYKKMIQGGLSKTDTRFIIDLCYGNTNWESGKHKYLMTKDADFLTILRIKFSRIYVSSGKYKGFVGIKLSSMNKFISSFTSFKYKKNKNYSDIVKTDSKYVYIMDFGIGFNGSDKITSAKYDKQKLQITVVNYADPFDDYYKLKGTFKKLKNGKYRLVSVKKIG